jgi:hypothetical protein
MLKIRIVSLFALSLAISAPAQARVFNFKTEKLATYLKATGGMSNVKKSGYEFSSGEGLNFPEQVPYNFTGEFGLLFSMTKMNVRLGVELFRPSAVMGMDVKNSAGSVVYNMDINIYGY